MDTDRDIYLNGEKVGTVTDFKLTNNAPKTVPAAIDLGEFEVSGTLVAHFADDSVLKWYESYGVEPAYPRWAWPLVAVGVFVAAVLLAATV